MRRLTEPRLFAKCNQLLTKRGFPNALESVEVDGFGNSESPDGVSYWAYLHTGYRSEGGAGCHTLHEDTWKELADELNRVVRVENDTEGYGE